VSRRPNTARPRYQFRKKTLYDGNSARRSPLPATAPHAPIFRYQFGKSSTYDDNLAKPPRRRGGFQILSRRPPASHESAQRILHFWQFGKTSSLRPLLVQSQLGNDSDVNSGRNT
jgi:hypothetical protein